MLTLFYSKDSYWEQLADTKLGIKEVKKSYTWQRLSHGLGERPCAHCMEQKPQKAPECLGFDRGLFIDDLSGIIQILFTSQSQSQCFVLTAIILIIRIFSKDVIMILI